MAMVKGISKQVILVHAPDPQLFEQAIFILKDNAPTVTDEALLKEAGRIINTTKGRRRQSGPVWAIGGALLTGAIWLITIFL